jgi:hypothetical protein
MGSYKSEPQSPETPLWLRRTHESISGFRKELSASAEIKINGMMAQNMKSKECKIEKNENLDHVTEDLKQMYQQRRNDCLDTGKEETSTIKIKYSEFR